MAAQNAEEFLLRLNQQISGPASVAAGALAKLEGQIRSEEKALHGMEDSLRAAKTKLTDLQRGFGGKVDISAVAKARAEIDKLQGKIQSSKDNLDALAGSRGAVEKAGGEADAAKQAKVQAKAQEQAEKAAKTEAAAKARIAEKAQADAEKAAKGEAAAAAKKDGEAKRASEKAAKDIATAAKGEAAAKSKLDAKVKADAEKAAKGEAAAAAKKAAEKKRTADKSAKDSAAAAKKATAESEFTKLKEAAEGADGPIGKIAKTFDKIKAAGPAAVLVAIVVVMVAIAAAAIAGAIALTKFALASADASRSSRLMSNAAAGGSMVGAELEAVINDVANTTPLARDRIAEMARSMEVAKLRGRDMQVALQTAATAASAIGDSAASAFTSIAEKSQFARRFLLTKADLAGTGVEFAEVAASIAKTMGISVAAATTLIQRGGVSVSKGLEAMNDAVQKKFGKTVAAQMLSLNTQFEKMKEGIGRLFTGVDIEPFLRGLKLITGLFNEQTVTGAALKTLFVSMFSGLAAASEGIFPIISAFLRGMVIGALTAYVAFLKVKTALNEAFGGSSASKIDWIQTAMVAGKYAVYGLGIALFAIVGIFALIAAVFIPLIVVLSLPFIIAAAAVYGLYKGVTMIGNAIAGMFGAVVGALSALTGLDLGAVGVNIAKSLASGISSAASFVVDAVKSLGAAAMGALTGKLLIRSPSRVFMAYGRFTAEGFADGVEEGTPAANDTVKQLGSAEPSSGGPQQVSAPRGGDTFVFNYYGPLDAFDDFKRRVLDVFEQEVRGGSEGVPA